MTNILRISDIENKDILYYDAELQTHCYRVCQQRDILYLPSLDEPEQVYVRDDRTQAFIPQPIIANMKVDGSQPAFCTPVSNAFRQHYLLLVYTGGELSGVLHFSDYNKSAVSVYLFEMFFQYDRLLRASLQAQLLTNTDMLKYFESQAVEAKTLPARMQYQSKIEDYRKRKDELERLPPFQSFSLGDLIGFANAHGNKLHPEVARLRPMILRPRPLETAADRNAGGPIQGIVAFQRFCRGAMLLQHDYQKLHNQVAFLQG